MSKTRKQYSQAFGAVSPFSHKACHGHRGTIHEQHDWKPQNSALTPYQGLNIFVRLWKNILDMGSLGMDAAVVLSSVVLSWFGCLSVPPNQEFIRRNKSLDISTSRTQKGTIQ
jgi:hypothetical protein